MVKFVLNLVLQPSFYLWNSQETKFNPNFKIFVVVDHFIDKNKVDNTKIDKTRLNYTKFRTNLTVQAVYRSCAIKSRT